MWGSTWATQLLRGSGGPGPSRSEASHTLLHKPPPTPNPGLTPDQLTQSCQAWDPGIHMFESSPGDSRAQRRLRTHVLRPCPGWPTKPLPVPLLCHSQLCLWCLLLQHGLSTCSAVTLSGTSRAAQMSGVHISTAGGVFSAWIWWLAYRATLPRLEYYQYYQFLLQSLFSLFRCLTCVCLLSPFT